MLKLLSRAIPPCITPLYNAAGNNGLFVSDASHQEAKGAIVESQKDLELIGGGKIGRVSLAAGSEDAYKNLTILEVRDGATTIAAIDAKDSASIAAGTVDITNIDVVEAYQGAKVTAANAKVDEVSTQNADIVIAGDLEFKDAYVFGGSVTAKNADMTAVTLANDAGDVGIINGSSMAAYSRSPIPSPLKRVPRFRLVSTFRPYLPLIPRLRISP